MRKTVQKSVRLTPDVIAKAAELSKLWNPAPDVVRQISFGDVAARCINRIHQQEIERLQTETWTKLPTAGLTPNRVIKTK